MGEKTNYPLEAACRKESWMARDYADRINDIRHKLGGRTIRVAKTSRYATLPGLWMVVSDSPLKGRLIEVGGYSQQSRDDAIDHARFLRQLRDRAQQGKDPYVEY